MQLEYFTVYGRQKLYLFVCDVPGKECQSLATEYCLSQFSCFSQLLVVTLHLTTLLYC
jgi:hypothetical protein